MCCRSLPLKQKILPSLPKTMKELPNKQEKPSADCAIVDFRVPRELKEALRKTAAAEGRSLEDQVLFFLHKGVVHLFEGFSSEAGCDPIN